MGVEPPFLYDPVKSGVRSPQKDFDPRAVSRISLTPTAPRPKQEGPLVSFNQHPDSWLAPAYGTGNATPMSPSVKVWVKWIRILQLILRIIELIASAGLLTLMILINGTDATIGWIMRIVPGFAILHTFYAITHLVRKSASRTPGSTASYMLFAALFDVSIAPFFAFSAWATWTNHTEWTTILSDQSHMPLFSNLVFYTAAAGGGLFMISLMISTYLAVTFRKITKLPPDMNPLEDNLTSRHKRSKSDMSNSTSASGKRISYPLESKRSSGATYEDLSRPPTIPFFHTRSGSTDSFSTYQSSQPGARDSRLDLPDRHYQIPTSSERSSMAELKRATYYDPSSASPPKRASYNSVPISDNASMRSSVVDMKRASFYDHDIPPVPKRGAYTEVSLAETDSHRSTRPKTPKTPRTPKGPKTKDGHGDGWYTRDSLPKRDSLPATSRPGTSDRPTTSSSRPNTRSQNSVPKKGYQPVHKHTNSFDNLDIPNPLEANPPSPRNKHRQSRDSPLSEINNTYTSADIADSSRVRNDSSDHDNFRNSKNYGDLRPGTPPIMVGANRQVSSGTDFVNKGGYKVQRRDVSGKIAEEGRGGWGARLSYGVAK